MSYQDEREHDSDPSALSRALVLLPMLSEPELSRLAKSIASEQIRRHLGRCAEDGERARAELAAFREARP